MGAKTPRSHPIYGFYHPLQPYKTAPSRPQLSRYLAGRHQHDRHPQVDLTQMATKKRSPARFRAPDPHGALEVAPASQVLLLDLPHGITGPMEEDEILSRLDLVLLLRLHDRLPAREARKGTTSSTLPNPRNNYIAICIYTVYVTDNYYIYLFKFYWMIL